MMAEAASITSPTRRVAARAGRTRLVRMPHICCSLSVDKLIAFKLVFVFWRSGRGGRGRVGAFPLGKHTK